MKLNFVTFERCGHLAWVTLNRPEVLNALHPPAHRELDQVWDAFASDRDLRVAIMTGAGDRAFCAGNDLKYSAAHPDEPRPGNRGGFGGLTARLDLNKPVIAAVNGYALGGGCEIALACDIVVAAEHARFGLPEPRVGLIAAEGGVHRLARQIPLKIAMGMMLTGNQMTAPEAHRWGLVTEVVSLAGLRAAAERWAGEIMECSPLAVAATKEAAMGGLGMPLGDALARSYPAVARLRRSSDFVEGPRAFAEKRKPIWRAE